MKRVRLLAIVLLLICSACAVKPEITPENDIAGMPWTLYDTELALGGDDPIEPFNRSMFAVTDFLMQYLAHPVSWVYCSILPKEVIQRIDNVSDNLAFPGRMVSCLCQARFQGAGISLSRFLINSTLGVAGIFDPAGHFWGLYRRVEDMGHAFRTWGMGPGCILILPLSSAVNIRDQIGGLFDSLLDLKIIIPYAGYVSSLNRVMNAYDSYNMLTESAADPYELYKLYLLGTRYIQVEDIRYKMMDPPPSEFWSTRTVPSCGSRVISLSRWYHPENPLIDTMRNPMFTMQRMNSRWWTQTSLWNRDFPNMGTVRTIKDPENGSARKYQFWNEKAKEGGVPRKNELVIMIPGVGTHYTGHTVRAFAELFSDAGYAVVSTSSTMNWVFADSKDSAFPGYVPEDTANLRRHLQLILKDLAENKEFHPERIIVAGYSLGAVQTLHLAAMEEQENTLHADRYIAMNPPVDIWRALGTFDRLAEIPKMFTRSQYFRNMGDAVIKYLPAAQQKYVFQPDSDMPVNADAPKPETPEYYYRIRVSPEQAGAMISASFRMTVRELLVSDVRNGFLKSPDYPWHWGDRQMLYRNIDSLSGMDYARKFILPRYPGMTLNQLRENSSLRAIGPFLKESPKVRIMHNLDDPLISQEDTDFLCRTLGDRIVWFDCGAHLGNLYMIAYHNVLLRMAQP